MKATRIVYERVFNLGNYQSERISIELAIEAEDKAERVLQLARQFVWDNRPRGGQQYPQLIREEEAETEPITPEG